MHPDLVRTPRQGETLYETEATESARQADACPRRLAFIANDDVSLAALAIRDQQGSVDDTVAQLPVTNHQRQVIFFHDPFAKFLVQCPQCAAALGEHQAARRFAIQPVHEGQVPEVGSRMP